MTSPLIKEIEKLYLKDTVEELNPGDSVKVMVRIKEGTKERLQGYEGVVIRLSGSGINRTVTVRRVFQGVSVERVFFLHSPKVDSIKVLRSGRVRRAKLYYLRGLTGKAARIQEKTTLRDVAAKAQKVAAKEASKQAAAAPKEPTA
jgi:large subunit ribosomal protein L19